MQLTNNSFVSYLPNYVLMCTPKHVSNTRLLYPPVMRLTYLLMAPWWRCH